MKVCTHATRIIGKIRRPEMWSKLRELQTRQFLPTEVLQETGRSHARNLLSHARRNVPYYRHLLREVDNDGPWSDFREYWNRIPLLTKDILRSKSLELIAQNFVGHKAIEGSSGGSTGKPVSFMANSRQFDLMNAYMALVFTWAGWVPGEMVLHLWGGREAVGRGGPLRNIMNRLSGRLVLPVYSFDNKAFMRWWEALLRYRPTILYVYPSVAAAFAQWLERTGREPRGVKGVFCSAEVLLPHHRQTLERVFGCKVYN
ncbi:MAG: hypothetical protein GF344_16215, partial [Chitinivibrionales bacterium]|nr:hypothetical protein [Chitinivibrionales bacterium]MBD3358237.1 hypothetical protein [Chitinivibrionales bacterium]